MVSHELLEMVHHRLSQIKQPACSSSYFGNVSILAVGDFYQIPPVMSKQLFSHENSLKNLWHLFSVYELQEIVRQKKRQ